MAVKRWEDVYGEPATAVELMVRSAVTHERMMTKVIAHKRVLEVGTGTGRMSAFVSRFCPTTVSLDSNSVVLDAALKASRHLGKNLRFVSGDGFRLPFTDRSFDACFSQGLLEHFSDVQIVLLIKEQLRVADHVYASIPSLFYPHLGRFGPGLMGNERLLTLRRWVQILKGFDVLGAYYSDFKLLTIGSWTLPWPIHILLEISAQESHPTNQAQPTGAD